MCHSLQMMLFSRIFSFNRSRIPLKFFHFGDVNFPLKREKIPLSHIATLVPTANQSEPRHQRPLLFLRSRTIFWLIDPLNHLCPTVKFYWLEEVAASIRFHFLPNWENYEN